jgi:hypothetical protein
MTPPREFHPGKSVKKNGKKYEEKTGHPARFVLQTGIESETGRRNDGCHRNGIRPHRESGRASCERSKTVARTPFRA